MTNSITTHVAPRQANLHTHSWYCGHGTGELSAYIQSAKDANLALLGFSEHCPVPDHRWRNSRMDFSQLDVYVQECRNLQRKEKDITILCGFECDHDPRYVSWYREHLHEGNRADYLAFGVHYLDTPEKNDTFVKKLSSDKRWLHTYTDRYINGILSGNYHFGVHPDLFGMFYTTWDAEAISCSKSILEAAASQKLPLEINGYGCRKPMIETTEGKRLMYPLRQFWELATDYTVPIIVNSDAHRPEDLNLHGVGAFELADGLGLQLSGWIVERTTENFTTLSCSSSATL
jgi:histidinol-phosphatase (PHP family)